MDIDDLENRFKFHPATTQERMLHHELIRDAALDLALTVNSICPDGRELSLAITKIEEAMYWANAAVARQPEQSISARSQ